MSKITDALHKADADRRRQAEQSARPASGYFQTLKEELWEEVRDLEEALSRRGAPAAPPQGPAASGTAGVATDPPSPPAIPAAPVQAKKDHRVPAAPPVSPATPEAWDQRLQRARQQLAGYEQRSARKHAEQDSLKAKLGACEQLLVDAQQEQAELQERLATIVAEAASIETERVSWKRRVEALHECQLLVEEAKAAEQDLQANAAMAAQVVQSQQQIAQELSRYQARGEMLQKRLDQLRFRLGQALALTGTVDTGSP